MPDAALLEAIRAVLAASPFHGEGRRKVWARLRLQGVRTSRRRVVRLMREHDLLAPSRVGSPRGPRNHDGTIIPDTLDTMRATDMTTTWTGEGQAAVFVAVDHQSAGCVGLHAARVDRTALASVCNVAHPDERTAILLREGASPTGEGISRRFLKARKPSLSRLDDS